jgi:urease accessory protein
MEESRRAIAVLEPGQWRTAEVAGSVTLGYDERYRRRFRLSDDAGGAFLLDLPRARPLADGQGLRLAGGGVLVVRAAAEPLARATCAGPEALARIAWHLGNRHLPVQVLGDAVLLRWDGVIVEMLRGLGAAVEAVSQPFTPEAGAYAGVQGTAGHGDHDHDHHHGHFRDHDHDDLSHDHDHGP